MPCSKTVVERVASFPAGSPLRGLVSVPPIGRNFHSVDPRCALATGWETGQAMADSLLERRLKDAGEYPKSVGLSIWERRRFARPAMTSPRSCRQRAMSAMRYQASASQRWWSTSAGSPARRC